MQVPAWRQWLATARAPMATSDFLNGMEKEEAIEKMVAYLEEKGVAVNHASAKRREDGSIYVIYLQDEIAGFAIQLINK